MKKIIFLIIILFAFSTTVPAQRDPKPKHKRGYNYKAHQKRNAKYKRNNEKGKFMKCNRKHSKAFKF